MDQPAHTAYAMRAFGLAQMFTLFVGSPTLVAADGRPLPIELTTPHGLSTGGGTQNLQHITMTYADRTIMFGSFDQLKAAFEIRSFEYLGARYGERWRAELPFARSVYDELLRRLEGLATSQQISLVVKDPPPAPGDQVPTSTLTPVSDVKPRRWLVPIVIALVVGAAVAVGAVMTLR